MLKSILERLRKFQVALYDVCADAFKNSELTLHSIGTFTQLSSIDSNTLRAPEGEHDDRADSFALAVYRRLAERVEPRR